MTIDQLVIALNWIASVGIPLLVALITTTGAPVKVRALVQLGLNLLATAIISVVTALVAHTAIDWFAIVFAFVTGFVVSGASYLHIWKPTQIAAAVAQFGVKGDHALSA